MNVTHAYAAHHDSATNAATSHAPCRFNRRATLENPQFDHIGAYFTPD
jgi:hypothetical protein